MCARFATKGDPNDERLPEWKPYPASERATLIYNQNLQVRNDPRAEIRDYLTAD